METAAFIYCLYNMTIKKWSDHSKATMHRLPCMHAHCGGVVLRIAEYDVRSVIGFESQTTFWGLALIYTIAHNIYEPEEKKTLIAEN